MIRFPKGGNLNLRNIILSRIHSYKWLLYYINCQVTSNSSNWQMNIPIKEICIFILCYIINSIDSYIILFKTSHFLYYEILYILLIHVINRYLNGYWDLTPSHYISFILFHLFTNSLVKACYVIKLIFR